MAQQPIDQSQLDATINAQSLQGQTIGSGANQIVQRDGSGNIDADSVSGFTVGAGATQIVQRDGSGNNNADTVGGATIGSGANQIPQLNGSGTLVLSGATPLELSTPAGEIVIDNNDAKRMTWNDGFGNFNIRCGIYSTGTTLNYATATDGGACITMNSELSTGATKGEILLTTYPLNTGSAGDNVGNTLQSALYMDDELTFSNGNTGSGPIIRFKIETDGTLSIGNTPNYETLVTTDDDIPNKKYVDDRAVPNYERQTNVTSGTTVINTTVNTTASSGGKSYLQVFVNNDFVMEGTPTGSFRGFTVTGTNQITLINPPGANFDIMIYSWS